MAYGFSGIGPRGRFIVSGGRMGDRGVTEAKLNHGKQSRRRLERSEQEVELERFSRC
jgi:hypothetical protein